MALFDNSNIKLDVLKKRAFNYRWAEVPDGVIPLTAADPDYPVAPEIQEAMMDYVKDGYFSYTPKLGYPEFRDSISKALMERKGEEIDPNLILPIDSAARGMYVIAQTVLRQGDEMIVFDPVDYLFRESCLAAGGKVVLFPAKLKDGYIDLSELENYITPKTRMIGLCNPHNPYGVVYRPEDLEHILRLASKAQVDMVTFDGAGGGSGYSPCKMMNEWCLPTVVMESILYGILNKLAAEGMELPHVAITGGFATEDQVYKALALGAPYISAVGLCRSSMAAAMSAKKIGDLIEAGKVPPELARFGTTKEELFSDLPELRGLYGSAADGFSTGAVGVYSYLNRIAYGLRHFAALNRKFDVKHIGRRDVFPLTRDAKELLDGTWLR